MLHLGHPRRATGESLGPGSAWRGIPLPRTHFPAQGGGRVTELTGHESASPSRLHEGALRPVPSLRAANPTKAAAPTALGSRPPGGWTLCTLLPSSRRQRLNPDTMDSVRPLWLMLLSLLLVGTALGDASQAPPGTPPTRAQGTRFRPGQAAGVPRTPAPALCALLPPNSCRAPQVCTFCLCKALLLGWEAAGTNLPTPTTPGSLSLHGDAADLLPLRRK